MSQGMTRHRSLQLIVALVLVASLHITALGESCHALAASRKVEPDWLEQTSVQGSRTLPSNKDSLLGYSNWPEDQDGNPQQVEDKRKFFNLDSPGCPRRDLTRYKWYNGTLWTDTPHLDFHRQCTVEMLLLSKWLYKDLPDMDIIFNASDQVVVCTDALPVLQHTVLDPVSTVTGNFDINLSHLAHPNQGWENRTTKYTRGYAIPYLDVWHTWSLSPGQMRAYSECIQQRFGNGVPTSASPTPIASKGVSKDSRTQDPWATARIPRLVWRGSSTGYYKGWPTGSSTRHNMYSDPFERALWNKRLYCCCLQSLTPQCN